MGGGAALKPSGTASSFIVDSLPEGIGFVTRSSAGELASGGLGVQRTGPGASGSVATGSIAFGEVAVRNATAGIASLGGLAEGSLAAGAAPATIGTAVDSTGSADGRLRVKNSELESSATVSNGFTGLPAMRTS